MANIDQSLVNDMWGGVVTNYSFSIPKHSFELLVKVLDGDVIKRFQVLLSDIASFEFNDENHYQWDYIELSDVYVDPYGESQLKVQFVFWLEAAILTVICGDIDIQRQESKASSI